MSGAGVASTWEGESGYVAALPLYYDGTDAVTLEMVRNTDPDDPDTDDDGMVDRWDSFDDPEP